MGRAIAGLQLCAGTLRRIVPLAATAVLLAVILTAGEASAACLLVAAPPAFDVVVHEPPVAYDFSKSRDTLAEIAVANGSPTLGHVPIGLTLSHYDLKITVETDSTPSGQGFCAHLDSAEVVVGLTELQVLVDRRYPPGSCERWAILEHEREHVEVYREAIRHYEPAINAVLAAVHLPITVPIKDRSEAKSAFLQPLGKAMAPIFDAIRKRAHDGNERLDQPGSYDEVFSRCGEW